MEWNNRPRQFETQGYDHEVVTFEVLKKKWRDDAVKPPGNDQAIAGLAEALVDFPEDTPLIELIKLGVEFRTTKDPTISVSEVAGIIRASICSYVMHVKEMPKGADRQDRSIPLDPLFSYEDLQSAAEWTPKLEALSQAISKDEPTDVAMSQMNSNIFFRNVQTTLFGRYRPQELTMQMLRERFGDMPINYLDVGAGILEGAQQLVLKAKYPMAFQAVYGSLDEVNEKLPDRFLLDKVNRLLALPSIINQAVCVDKQQVYNNRSQRFNEGVLEWARSSLRPNEVLNSTFMHTFEGLTQQKADNVAFFRGNPANQADMNLFREQIDGAQFAHMSLITVLHQLKNGEGAAIIKNLLPYLLPGGTISIQEHAYLKNNGNSQPLHNIRQYADWHRKFWRYQTFIYDSAHRKPGWQQLYFQKDSRCDIFAFGPARLVMNGALYPAIDIAKHASTRS